MTVLFLLLLSLLVETQQQMRSLSQGTSDPLGGLPHVCVCVCVCVCVWVCGDHLTYISLCVCVCVCITGCHTSMANKCGL